MVKKILKIAITQGLHFRRGKQTGRQIFSISSGQFSSDYKVEC